MEVKITEIKRTRDQRKTRVAAYCRVSTRLEEQEESLETQEAYYSSLIRRNPNWEYAGIYADEKSGTKARNRPGFQRLIEDALAEKVDLILVKSVSRFARNIVDSEATIRKLKAGGVYVHFEREGIKTEDPTSGMILSLMAAIAQDESKSIGENVKWGYRERFKRGQYNLGNNRMLGYDCVNGKLVPNDDAYLVCYIYDLFLQGVTPASIAEKLNRQGLTGLRGKKFSGPSIKYILQNETYAGDKKLQKQAPKNFLTKQPDKRQRFESHFLTDDHEAIIPRDIWDEAQKRMREMSPFTKLGKNTHFLYGRLSCAGCGAPMTRKTFQEYRREGEPMINYKAWTCSERLKGRKGNGCRCKAIRESFILKEISSQMGWGYLEDGFFPEELFIEGVEKVRASTDEIEVEKRI